MTASILPAPAIRCRDLCDPPQRKADDFILYIVSAFRWTRLGPGMQKNRNMLQFISV